MAAPWVLGATLWRASRTPANCSRSRTSCGRPWISATTPSCKCCSLFTQLRRTVCRETDGTDMSFRIPAYSPDRRVVFARIVLIFFVEVQKNRPATDERAIQRRVLPRAVRGEQRVHHVRRGRRLVGRCAHLPLLQETHIRAVHGPQPQCCWSRGSMDGETPRERDRVMAERPCVRRLHATLFLSSTSGLYDATAFDAMLGLYELFFV